MIVTAWFSCLCLKDQLGLCSLRCDDRKLFCELASTCWLAGSGFCEERKSAFRIQLHCAIYRSNSFVLMLHHCVNLKAIRYESMSLNRIAADKSHGVIVSLTIWFKVVEFSFFKHEVVIAISCKTIDEKIILFENSSKSWRKAYVGTATVLIQQTSLYRVFR